MKLITKISITMKSSLKAPAGRLFKGGTTLLLIEIDGPVRTPERAMEEIGKICLACDAQDVLMAPDSRKRAKMWEIRRQVSLRIEESWPVYVPEDVVVPIGSIADFVTVVPAFEREYGIKIYCFGHAGDRNIHLNITAGGGGEPTWTGLRKASGRSWKRCLS